MSKQSLSVPNLNGFNMTPTDKASHVFPFSGGMYNTNFPQWEDATATGNKKYDGQFAYAYAKRGQVLLCERWAATHPKVFDAAVTPHCSICSYGIVKVTSIDFTYHTVHRSK